MSARLPHVGQLAISHILNMRDTMRPLIAGNWKMNGLGDSLHEIERLVAELLEQPAAADILICPPFTLIDRAEALVRGSAIQIGGQDCHVDASGAHTGDISAAMLADSGAKAVIVGHSERRANHGETSARVAGKAKAAHVSGLMPIICIGETEAERNAGHVLEIVLSQLRDSIALVPAPNYVIAYEPVWAIGTGKTPTLQDIADIHSAIRGALIDHEAEPGKQVRILYGGSVKPDNAAAILCLPHVNGALVGGASLKATDFMKIIRAA